VIETVDGLLSIVTWEAGVRGGSVAQILKEWNALVEAAEAERKAKQLESGRRYEARNKATRISPERNAAKNKAYRDSPEKRAAAVARAKEWYKNNKERADNTKREWAKRNADRVKANSRNKELRKYGLTEVTWIQKFEAQGSKCACCGTTEPRGKWQTDHCWKTGIVRGILCVPCNVMIANHTSDRLRLGADYVDHWASAHTTVSEKENNRGW